VTPQKEKELNMMHQLVNEAEGVISSPNRSLDEFGRLLHEGWKLKRSLTQKITNAAIDEIYDAGISAGALGGKLLGAGGGGFMLFFVPPERREALRMRLKKHLCVPFKFSSAGSRVIVYEPEEAYDRSLASERREVYSQNGSASD
jgi:D-glycero-alpha-D-manno-heptose-7-phosphate kinase